MSDELLSIGIILAIFTGIVSSFWANDKDNFILKFIAIALWVMDVVVMILLLTQLIL